MKAWLLDSLAGVDSLRLGDVPAPAASGDHVLLNLQYAALNPADRYLAEGHYPARPRFPHILGRDGLGTIAGTGKKMIVLRGETGVSAPGTFAQQAAVPAENLVEVPDGWTDQEAAGATLVYVTAYQALTMWDDLPPRALVLISGASGGVGVACIQLAKSLGHTVIALTRHPGKSDRLRELGADVVLETSGTQWMKEARDRAAGRRVDLAIDNIGGELLPQMIETLGQGGRVSCVGRLAGPVPQFNTASLFFRRLRLGGVAVAAYSNAQSRAAWHEVVSLLARTGARPVVDQVFEFARLKEAFARLAEGPMGKVLLSIPA